MIALKDGVGKCIIEGATLMIISVGLVLFSFMGNYCRMFTDDYCYSHYFNVLGLMGTLKGYYFITTFTAHRYALTFFEWVIDRFGILGIQLTPLIALTLWGVALFLLLRKANDSLKTGRTRLDMALLAGLLLFFTIYLMPNIYQSLYWRTGILPYTAPVICGLWLAVFLFYRQRSRSILRYPILVLGAFLSAGFSEAGAIFVAALFGFVLAWSLWALLREDQGPWQRLGAPSLAVIAAILLALIIMYLSPVNVDRQDAYQAPASIGMTFVYAFRFTMDFIWLSFRTQPLPNLVFCLLIAGLSYLTHRQSNGGSVSGIKISLLTAAFAWAAIMAIHLPSAYVEKSPPADRTLVMARFSLLAAEMIIFFFIGRRAAAAKWPFWLIPRLREVAAIFLVLAGWVYLARAEVRILQIDFPRYQRVSQVWDQRDRQIKDAVARGEKDVLVLPIDSQYIGGLLEFYPQPNWVNMCAAQYYNIGVIRAAESW